MIVFDLECRAAGHRFEGWFGSSEDFEGQRASGLLECPLCGCDDIAKAVMAPHVGRKGNQRAEPSSAQAKTSQPVAALANSGPQLPPEAVALFRAVAAAQAEALKASRWVGDSFAEQARAIHYGEQPHEAIHGQATPDQARDLIEEGVTVAPLLFPVIPPEQAN